MILVQTSHIVKVEILLYRTSMSAPDHTRKMAVSISHRLWLTPKMVVFLKPLFMGA